MNSLYSFPFSAYPASRTILVAVFLSSNLVLSCLYGKTAASSNPTAVHLSTDKQSAVRYSEILVRAWKFYDGKLLDQAKREFNVVLEAQDAKGDDIIQALFGIGLCYVNTEPFPEKEKALKSFQKIVEDYPGSKIAPWALMEIGNLKNEKGNTGQKEAQGVYRRVIGEYPESMAIHEAVLRLANSLFYELKDSDMNVAASLLENHLQQHPENPLASTMHFRLDYYYSQIRQDYEKCIVHAVKLGELGMSDPFRSSRQYWHIAEIYRLMLNQPDKAIPWYRKIILDIPKSEHVYAARQRLNELNASLETAP